MTKRYIVSGLLALLITGCAHLPATKTQTQEAKGMLRTMAPEVVAYYNQNHKCPPLNDKTDSWAKELQTKQSPHWAYTVLPGKETGSCLIEADYKQTKDGVGTITPVLSLTIKEGTPASVVELQVKEISSNTNTKNISTSFTQTYSPNEKTCYKMGGHLDKDLGCILF